MTRKRGGAPNVVLFISDQQRADTMPGMRRVPVETPHLDWLAAKGTVFGNAFCASPLCAPARAALLSGLYPHTTGMIANYEPDERRLPVDVRLLADYLRPLGYACAYTGKWHLGTGGDRRGYADFVSRSEVHDVDGPEQNDFLRFCARVPLWGSDIRWYLDALGSSCQARSRHQLPPTSATVATLSVAECLPLFILGGAHRA